MGRSNSSYASLLRPGGCEHVNDELTGLFGSEEINSHDEHEKRGASRFKEQSARDAHPFGERSSDVELTGSHAADETSRSQASEKLHEGEDGSSDRTQCADKQQSESIRNIHLRQCC